MLCVCALCNTSACMRVCVFGLLTTVTVKGCKLSRGMVMNGSVVTSQVLLPLCCLYAACSPIILQVLHVLGVSYGEWLSVGGFSVNVALKQFSC